MTPLRRLQIFPLLVFPALLQPDAGRSAGHWRVVGLELAAARLTELMTKLSPEQSKDLFHAMDFIGQTYMHGTHVEGIAARQPVEIVFGPGQAAESVVRTCQHRTPPCGFPGFERTQPFRENLLAAAEQLRGDAVLEMLGFSPRPLAEISPSSDMLFCLK